MAAKHADAERVEAAKQAEAHRIIEEKPEIRCKPEVPEPGAFRIREGEPEWNSLPQVEELLKAKKPERTEEEWITDLLSGPRRGLVYARKLEEASAELGYSQKRIEDELKERRGPKPGKEDGPSQAVQLVALGMGRGVQLWRSPRKVGYASVEVDGHREAYEIEGSEFRERLMMKYSEENKVKVGDRWIPSPPSGGALTDAIAQLSGQAKSGEERTPVIRVGGDSEVIWVDLGGPDWRAIRVTARRWTVEDRAGVPFVRSPTVGQLPLPTRDGDVRDLLRVVNVRERDFVLVVGWLSPAA
jgi:hypothetical protein